MYNLRILFTCLCAHVRREDHALVILPDARFGCPPMNEFGERSSDGSDREGEMASGHQQDTSDESRHLAADHSKFPMTPHVGAVEFDPADLYPCSPLKPHLYYRGKQSRRDYGIYLLSGQDMRLGLKHQPKGAPTESKGRKDNTKSPTCAGEELDVRWIAEVKYVDQPASWVDPLCLVRGSAAEIDGKPRVLARMKLKGGVLSSAILPRSEYNEPLVFGWKKLMEAKEEERYKQALSAAIAYDLPLAANAKEVSLILTDFHRPDEPKELKFSLEGRPFGYTLQLAIKNMPLEALLEVESEIFPKKAEEVDKHFAMYYSLSERPPRELWVPVKQYARSGAPICPSSRFEERPD